VPHHLPRDLALGHGFEFRFVRAVPVGTTLSLEWTVSGIEHKASLAGDIVSVEGRAVDDAGTVYVTATGRNLVRDRVAGIADRKVSPIPASTDS
jgi:acyl dehydratase